MAHIPSNAKWYLADIVEEFVIAGEPENVVHTNCVLIRADSPEEAFDRAVELGRQSNMTYTNTHGKTVTVTYRGLRDLNVIHGELEHGTELTYDEQEGMSGAEMAEYVSRKEDLGVFKPIETPDDEE